MSDYQRVCVICAAHGRTRKLEQGHVCPACLIRIADDLHAIVELASYASVEPVSGRGQGRTVPGSRPPICVDGVDPALTLIDLGGGTVTVLETLESWERLVREARCMAPYGPVSHARAITAHARQNDTRVTLTGCVTFLAASLSWWADTPDQPIEDFAGEIHACRRALSRWDPERAGHHGWQVDCPADVDGKTCGNSLHIVDADAVTRCRKCGSDWTTERLMLVLAETSDAHMWLDADAICQRLGVDLKTLQRWAREGRIARSHGLYDARPIALATRRFGT